VIKPSFAAATFVLLCFLCPRPGSAKEKTDILYFYNGDRITCEIKQMQQGQLTVKTDYTRTLTVDWRGVVRILSTNYFEVELENGRRYFGTLVDPGEDGLVAVDLVGTVETFSRDEVVFISPIEPTFLSRLKGNVSLGLDAYKAQSQKSVNSSAAIRYRTKKWYATTNLTLFWSSREGSEDIYRADLSLTGIRYFPNRWGTVMFAKAQHNSEQGLDLRLVAGGGAARSLIRSNLMFFVLGTGLAYTNEQYSLGTGDHNNLEAFFSSSFSRFIFRKPKSEILSTLNIFPSLSSWGRYRIEFEVAIQHEIISNLYLEFRVYDNYDSAPPTEDVIKNDWGLVTSIGYTFE